MTQWCFNTLISNRWIFKNFFYANGLFGADWEKSAEDESYCDERRAFIL